MKRCEGSVNLRSGLTSYGTQGHVYIELDENVIPHAICSSHLWRPFILQLKVRIGMHCARTMSLPLEVISGPFAENAVVRPHHMSFPNYALIFL